jgi:hypothetical protein
MKALIAFIVAVVLTLAMPLASQARGGHSWGGGRHTKSHGGTYVGGVGSSHRGGHYVGPYGGYGTHK